MVEVVSPSNPARDYVSKFNLYREAGVREGCETLPAWLQDELR